jgi:hypothetical protein
LVVSSVLCARPESSRGRCERRTIMDAARLVSEGGSFSRKTIAGSLLQMPNHFSTSEKALKCAPRRRLRALLSARGVEPVLRRYHAVKTFGGGRSRQRLHRRSPHCSGQARAPLDRRYPATASDPHQPADAAVVRPRGAFDDVCSSAVELKVAASRLIPVRAVRSRTTTVVGPLRGILVFDLHAARRERGERSCRAAG